ncbi:uncharacterized protein LOC107414123 [Ziziphus jujuba]|uniref:Uncharacterized protein LOC107414123 n=1 Tax=Ziziphus jujuba TaxID=326968 RepID=A0A6P3ZHN1_ZIZJJ|nr:uncharacterized protein LOC107414123 [Ziziphus jujuba]
MVNIYSTPPPSTTPTMSSMPPLQLSGYLSGDTIQVQGDSENLQFSLQFNIHNKQFSDNLNSPGTVAYNPEKQSCENSSFSSYVTPIAAEELNDQSQCTNPFVLENRSFVEEVDRCESETRQNDGETSSTVVTRLRSGVISPVSYFPRTSSIRKLKACEKVKSLKKSRGKVDHHDVLERVLRRRSCPIRPCSSYTFFVISTWDLVRSPSFGETSKRLSRMWSNLPRKSKKLYEEMAMKDNIRYKKQCKLLWSKSGRKLK